jgi:rhodanese-related sulfurtransferase
MSPSGAEVIRQIKQQVQEIDPAEVSEHLGNGVVLVDVRESEEWDRGHIPGAVHVPRGYLESRIDAAAPDRDARVILYCASGQRSALAAHTLKDLLG